MQISNVSVPEIYKESSDFRFFCKWFEAALSRIQYDTENMIDLYDSLRCPKHLLWMLGDTIGYKYDDRLSAAFNRLVMVYFMSMIRNKGSKDGVTLAAEVNLAQFMIAQSVKDTGNTMLEDRLEDTRIPVNSVYVTPHTAEGYIDVVYFSDEKPIDACIEYVRPVGMYVFQRAGVRFDARTKISIDARLTDRGEADLPSIGVTRVGHYTRDDYARMHRGDVDNMLLSDPRHGAWRRNPDYEEEKHRDSKLSAGCRALYSLQVCNNEHVVSALLHRPIFELGYKLDDVSVDEAPTYVKGHDEWNLMYHEHNERYYRNKHNRGEQTDDKLPANFFTEQLDVYTLRELARQEYEQDTEARRPFVNPGMTQVGDAIQVKFNKDDTSYLYTKRKDAADPVSAQTITPDSIETHSQETCDDHNDGDN